MIPGKAVTLCFPLSSCLKDTWFDKGLYDNEWTQLLQWSLKVFIRANGANTTDSTTMAQMNHTNNEGSFMNCLRKGMYCLLVLFLIISWLYYSQLNYFPNIDRWF